MRAKDQLKAWHELKEQHPKTVVDALSTLCAYEGETKVFGKGKHRYLISDHRSVWSLNGQRGERLGEVTHVLQLLQLDAIARKYAGRIGIHMFQDWLPFKKFMAQQGFRRSSTGMWIPPVGRCRRCPKYLTCVLEDPKVEE